MPDRIAKIIARAGICSRRQAEELIRTGRVTLDGEVLDSPAVAVGPEAKIAVDGELLPAAEPARLWRYHKPRGLLTTARDPQGRPTIYDRLPAGLPRLMPVGRLDLTSEGLLLLTTDGALKRKLELPATGWTRRYRVRVHGRVQADALASLAEGVRVGEVRYGPIQAKLDRQQGANAWLTMALAEGKNREIRRVCEHLGLDVNRLIRLAYGPFQLGQLKPGELAEVKPTVLAEQLGAESLGPGEAEAPKRDRSKWAKPKPKPRSKPRSKPKSRSESKPGSAKAAAHKGAKHAHRRRPL